VFVTRRVPNPAGFITNTWPTPSRPLTNAIFFPSGDQAGSIWKKSPAGLDGSPFSFVSR
jgi:hypothetical protein